MGCLNRNKQHVMKMQEQHEELLRENSTKNYSMFLNKGTDDEMEICCYKLDKFRTTLTYLFIILTCGILRLVYHWIPYLFLISTYRKCNIEEAEKILITEIYNGKHKIYHVKTLKILTPESIKKMIDDNNVLNHKVCVEGEELQSLSVHFENGEFRNLDKLLLFTLKKVTYIWDDRKREFIKLVGLDKGVSSEIFHQNKGLSANEQFTRRSVYGPNKIDVKESSILTLLFLEVLNPFYIFQILSFILWFVDNYIYYAIAIMAMSIFGITMSVIQTRKNERNLKATVHSSDVCTVMRRVKNTDDKWGKLDYESEIISTELLVPGDLLEIPAHGCIMHCDALLLTGNCILNESMLTGESVPVTKTAFPNIPDVIYDPKEHARHTLFCGTNVIQTRYFGNEKVLAVVVRTGFSTAKGSLVRSILYPPPVDFRFEKDSYRFVALLGLFAGIGFTYTVVTKVIRGVDISDLIIEALDLITIVVPPALPAAMSVGRFYAQVRLKNKQIYCISPRSINIAGSINCVCFDKTGTLTEDGLDLLCVVPTNGNQFQSPITNVESLPYNTFVCGLASCHSLTMIDKQITGDPLDLKMFESTKWIMEEYEVADNNKFNMIFPTVLKPPKNQQLPNQNIDNDFQIGIIREFPFSSSSQRMGVIIRKLGAPYFEFYCKGSPEMILNFVKPESVPDNFHDILENYTQEGYRVIALAHKPLKLSYAKVQKVQRDVIEQELNFLGLIVLENRLKPDTHPSIQHLNDAQIRVIMVTGDNILTAVSVAKDCDIITSCQSVITVNVDNSNPPELYYTLTNTKNKMAQDVSVVSNSASVMSMDTIESQINTISNSIKENKSPPQSILNNYRFAMTGKTWSVVKEYYPELLPRIVTRGTVFARMAPEQKQQLVQELQSLGYYVAMCGDGANDCGALKAAHTGVSLSDAESSVASPFTSKNPNITCVLNVIREGRAALVTSFGIFKYMAAYSLCQFISVLILYSIDSNLTDIEFLYIDLAIISIFAFFFGRNTAYSGKLVKETPLSSLISLSPLLSLTFQVILIIAFQVAAFEHLQMQEWYTSFNSTNQTNKDDNGCIENYTIFSVSSFQYIILAIVFSKGKPYRSSIFSNYGFIISAIVMTCLSVYLTLYPAPVLAEYFQLVLPDDFNFRLYLVAYAFVNFILSLFFEQYVIDNLIFKKLRFKFHNIDKSKKLYMAIDRDLNRDLKWPALSSDYDYKSVASPLNPLIACTAEIVIEKENKFDKNHILNKLYESSENEGIKNEFVSKSVGNTPLKTPVNGFTTYNETGYFSQDELFTSPPTAVNNGSSPSDDTFKSLDTFSNNTSYDLAHSQLHIEDLPYDESKDTFEDNTNFMSNSGNSYNIEENSISNFNSMDGINLAINLENKALELENFTNSR